MQFITWRTESTLYEMMEKCIILKVIMNDEVAGKNLTGKVVGLIGGCSLHPLSLHVLYTLLYIS